jgi:hypothetical protein
VAAKEVDTIPRIAPSGFAPGNAAEGFLEMAVIYFVGPSSTVLIEVEGEASARFRQESISSPTVPPPVDFWSTKMSRGNRKNGKGYGDLLIDGRCTNLSVRCFCPEAPHCTTTVFFKDVFRCAEHMSISRNAPPTSGHAAGAPAMPRDAGGAPRIRAAFPAPAARASPHSAPPA